MPPDIEVRAAEETDVRAIEHLLARVGLPVDGVADHWRTFVVARERGEVVACGGAEVYHSAALIRSIAVTPDHQRSGIGRHIVRQVLDRLAALGMRDFYLLTTTAEDYFARRGFKRIDRAEMHPELSASREMQGACPASAVCMRLKML